MQMTLLNCGTLTIEGISIGGLATYMRIKELDLIFDLGRCPISFIGMNHGFITHFHLDHYFGLPIYVSQRWISNMPPGEVFVPAEGVEQLQSILDSIAKLDSLKKTVPANGQCEIIVYSANHADTVADMSLIQIELLVHTWIDRYKELLIREDIKYVLPFENRGEECGVTLSLIHI